MSSFNFPSRFKLLILLSKIFKKNTKPFQLNSASNIRDDETIESTQLVEFFRQHNLDYNDLEIKQYQSGFSNLTYLISTSTNNFILRKPPLGAKALKGGHNMEREFQILSKLYPHFPKVPKPYLFSKDESIIGSPFYLMEKKDGYIIRPNIDPKQAPSKEKMEKICQSFIDHFAQLHNLNIYDLKLDSLGKIKGYNQRQIEGWIGRFNHSKTSELPSINFIAQWLLENIPQESKASIIHNDYKFDNVVLDSNDITSINAILDWEMATVGDPLMDLGTSLGYWIDQNDPQELHFFQLSSTALDGCFSREELLHQYSLKTGQDIANPIFYYTYGLFKIATIVQQIYFRYSKGFTKDRRFASLNIIVELLASIAKQSIQKNRISNLF